MLLIPDIAATYDLDQWLDAVTPWYHLYVTDIDLSPGITLADFVEASFPGYVVLKAIGWTDAIIVGCTATSYADILVWTRTMSGVPVHVYGYYVTDGQAGPLLWCERRDGFPVTLTLAGDQCEVLPTITWRADPAPGTCLRVVLSIACVCASPDGVVWLT